METKVFSDPITGLVKHVREIAIRRGGELILLHVYTYFSCYLIYMHFYINKIHAVMILNLNLLKMHLV